MTVTLEDLRDEARVGVSTTEDARLQSALDFAESTVEAYVTDSGVADDVIPDDVLDRAVMATAIDEFNRRKAPNGILNQQFAGQDGATTVPVRVSRDPRAALRPILSPWIGGLA